MEEPIVERFGSTVSLILQENLKRWSRDLEEKLRGDTELKPIKHAQSVQLVMDHLKIFHDDYESKFGLMEKTGMPALRDDTKTCISSTGYCAKAFLGLLMADRVHVADRQRTQERKKIGFVHQEVSTLAADSKDCPICQENLGVENLEGKKESPIKLVICCGQIVGKKCLKTWLKTSACVDILKENCPICRYGFPKAFLEKLLGEPEDDEKDDGNGLGEPTAKLSAPQGVTVLINPSLSHERRGLPGRQDDVPITSQALPVHDELSTPRETQTQPRLFGLSPLLDEQIRQFQEALRRGEWAIDDLEMEG